MSKKIFFEWVKSRVADPSVFSQGRILTWSDLDEYGSGSEVNSAQICQPALIFPDNIYIESNKLTVNFIRSDPDPGFVRVKSESESRSRTGSTPSGSETLVNFPKPHPYPNLSELEYDDQ